MAVCYSFQVDFNRVLNNLSIHQSEGFTSSEALTKISLIPMRKW